MFIENSKERKEQSVVTEKQKERKLIPLVEWPKMHTWPPLGGLRHLVFHAKANGFDRVIRRIGKRILIDEQEFFNWVDGQQEKGGKI